MKIEQNFSFHFGYPHDLPSDEHEITYCPDCKSRILWGGHISIIESGLQNKKCPVCGFKMTNTWNEQGLGQLEPPKS